MILWGGGGGEGEPEVPPESSQFLMGSEGALMDMLQVRFEQAEKNIRDHRAFVREHPIAKDAVFEDYEFLLKILRDERDLAWIICLLLAGATFTLGVYVGWSWAGGLLPK